MESNVFVLRFSQVKWLFVISFFVAFILDSAIIISLNIQLAPSTTLLMLIFWTTQLTDKTHFFMAILLGIFSDTTMNTLLGSHSIIFIMITFLVLRIRHSFKSYPRWQQTTIVIIYLYVFQILGWFILQPNLASDQIFYYWVSPFSAFFIWPVLYGVMQTLTHRSAF